MSEDTSVARSTSIDADRFWAVYDDAVPCVYGFLVRRTDDATAQDLTQEVFVTAARTFASGGAAKVTIPWLMSVAKSRLVDHHRAEGRRRRNLSIVRGRGPAREASAEERFEAAAITRATERALASLPGPQRAALVLHHLDDLSVAEVAHQLGRSVRATESLLVRARKGLRTALEETQP